MFFEHSCKIKSYWDNLQKYVEQLFSILFYHSYLEGKAPYYVISTSYADEVSPGKVCHE